MGDQRRKTRLTTVALAVCLVLLVLFSIIILMFYPKINIFFLMHRKYEVYGGMTDELKDSELFDDMISGKSFCFVGDSITHGSIINGIHWYQPLIPYINGEITDFSHGGWSVSNLADTVDNIPDADVYVIAIGINDILFPDEEDSAHTASEYASKCNELGCQLTTRSSGAKIYFISPWSFAGYDSSVAERGDMFRSALEETCKTNSYRYINPDPIIQSVFAKEGSSKYMYNDFHPNAPKGVGLFSYAVLKDAHDRRLENN